MKIRKNYILTALTCLVLVLTSIFFLNTTAALSTFEQNLFSTKSIIGNIVDIFNPMAKDIYWGTDNKLVTSIINIFSPAGKTIYEEASLKASLAPAAYIDYYYAVKKSKKTGVAKEIISENITDKTPDAPIVHNKYSLSQLMDYSFLVNEFYTVDRTTYIDQSLLNAEKLLNTDLRINKSDKTILIYHTHSQEAFIDSSENDSSTSIVAVGAYLADLLSEKYGFNVIHNTKVYDLKENKLDRNKAYTYAGNDLETILAQNPDIEVIIDLHRDGIDGEKMTTDINGKETAKLMFFNGLSRTVETGEIEALYNPNLSGNLAMSLQCQLIANEKYPSLMRHIYLKGYQYNLHFKPRSLLIEAGSQKNTFQEMLNAMEPLADILNEVLTKEQSYN